MERKPLHLVTNLKIWKVENWVKILWIAETKDIEPSNAKAVDLVGDKSTLSMSKEVIMA